MIITTGTLTFLKQHIKLVFVAIELNVVLKHNIFESVQCYVPKGTCMKYLPTLLLSSILLSGCATTNQVSGFTGGYSETQLDG